MKKYLIGAAVAPVLGLLLWKLLFPGLRGLDGVFVFMLGAFCLWTALACILGFLTPESTTGYRWAYGGVFLALFAVQLLEGFTDFHAYTLADIVLLSTLYLIEQQERRSKEE